MDRSYFAKRVKELRKEKNLTQDELAEHIKVSKPTIISFEKTEGAYPQIENIEKLAKFFNVSIDSLLGIEQAENNYDFKNYADIARALGKISIALFSELQIKKEHYSDETRTFVCIDIEDTPLKSFYTCSMRDSLIRGEISANTFGFWYNEQMEILEKETLTDGELPF